MLIQNFYVMPMVRLLKLWDYLAIKQNYSLHPPWMETIMKLINNILSWAFGSFFLLIGFLNLSTSIPLAAIFFIIAFLLLPPIRRLSHAKTNIVIPSKIRALCLVTLFVALIFTSEYESNKLLQEAASKLAAEQAAEKAQEEQKTIQYFNSNRDQILSEIKTAISENDLPSAIANSKKYLISEDEELKALYAQSENGLKAAEIEKKTLELLKQLKTIPTKEYQKNKELYQQLLDMHPETALYKTKVAFYSEEIKKENILKANKEKELKEKKKLADKWIYYNNKDEMTGKTTVSANIYSENTVNFSFPYNGTQKGRLQIRNHPSFGKDIILSIEKGQIQCQSYNGCTVKVRFDNNKAVSWNASGAADNSTEVVFISNYSLFIKKLRNAKTVLIQPSIYQEGQPIFRFEVGGFNYDRYKNGN